MDRSPLALVIEDEIALASLFARTLQGAGFRARAIYDGQEALEILQAAQEVPELVVLDFNLPRVNGLDLLKLIRADARYTETRVMLTTSEAAATAGALEKLADIVLLKPVSMFQLRELARRFRGTQ